ncbi:FHA domain-containing protein [Nocardioides gilvus]|uniref:FHA domain-containing protein n=1 Tax=Nocardioides gilvus TaxID=1735589 RepID=UPI000D742C9D|nr:FHA domain-containing protein [Nocardioides gilvus]
MQQVSVREGRPGQWIGVFGDSLTLLVPGAERDRALRWWSLVDDGAGVERLLDALLAEGLSTLDDFVVVEAGDEGRVRVLVRGGATLTAWTAEGQVQVQAAGRLWAEDDFVGIVALRVVLPGHDRLAPATGFAVQPGLCRVGEVVWGSVPAPPASVPVELSEVPMAKDPDPDPDPGPVTEAPRAERPIVLGKRVRSEPSPSEPREEAEEAVRVNVVSSTAPPVAPPEREAETAPLSAVPLVAPVPPPVPLPATPPSTPSATPPSTPPSTPSATPPSTPSATPPEQADPAPPTPVSTPVPEWQEEITTHLPAVELSGLTLLGLAAEPDVATQSRPEPASTSTSRPSGGVVRLRFSHGPSLAVDRPLVIGRAPAARSGSAGATLVTVPSPQQEVSSSHLEIRPGHGVDSGTALVTDLGSTNGTVLTQPGLGPEELRPGAPVVLLPGAVIDLGDGVRIHVDQG